MGVVDRWRTVRVRRGAEDAGEFALMRPAQWVAKGVGQLIWAVGELSLDVFPPGRDVVSNILHPVVVVHGDA